MKKTLLFIAVFTMAVCAKAQGTWRASGSEASVAASTEIDLGISGLKCMHSDASGVSGKSDSGAPKVSYNGVDYENAAFIQGATNGMYFAFLPSKNGTLDLAIKMGSDKKTFVLELTDNLWTSMSVTAGDLAALTTNKKTGDAITGTADYFTTPAVYDTYHQSSATWNGTVSFQTSGSNVYMVMSFPVSANKTYVVGCFGSKLMLRGVTLGTTTQVGGVDLNRPYKISTEYFNIAGVKLGKNFSELPTGVYVRKCTFNNGEVTTEKISKIRSR